MCLNIYYMPLYFEIRKCTIDTNIFILVYSSIKEIVNFKDKIIIFALDSIKWIILENENQLDFFYLLKKYSLKKALGLFGANIQDVATLP